MFTYNREGERERRYLIMHTTPLKAAKQRTKECLYLEWIWAIVCAEEKKTSNQVLIKYDKVAPLSLQSSQDLSSFFNR